MVSAIIVIDKELTEPELRAIVTLERVGGTVSLIAVLLIFVAYYLVRRVRNVQNTFIVFASVSNIGASVASIIALDGIYAGKYTALCQAQSFMFEMFMQSDPWWSLAMSVNVFLVFYFRASPDSFRKWWWLYCLICYGGPFAIALALLLIRIPGRDPIYGEATIWCWVDRTWDSIRIYTYYMLIWVCILGSMIFYFMVGWHVFRSRNRLHSFSTSKSREAGNMGSRRGKMSDGTIDGSYGTVVTEVQVIHSKARHGHFLHQEPKKAHTRQPTHVSFDHHQSHTPQQNMDSLQQNAYQHHHPSTSLDQQSAASQYFSSVTSAPPRKAPKPPVKPPSRSFFYRTCRSIRRTTNKFAIGDPIKRAYLRTSLLFGVSVLVTWIPSSLNRIHGWQDGTSPYHYHVATAAVLPLQGLWNAVIFFVTSWRAIREAFRARHGGDGAGMGDDERGMECSERMAGPGGMRRTISRDDRELDSELEYPESGAAGSDVELTHISREQSFSG